VIASEIAVPEIFLVGFRHVHAFALTMQAFRRLSSLPFSDRTPLEQSDANTIFIARSSKANPAWVAGSPPNTAVSA
jgi:hypothetical protein